MNQVRPYFTLEEDQQVVHMLNNAITDGPSTSTATAGTLIPSMSNYINHNWIVDTGASNYMTSNLKILKECQPVPPSQRSMVQLPTGNVVSVSHISKSSVFKDQDISNVLFIPDFKCNLLSVSQLTKELQCSAAFFPDFFIVQDLYTGLVKGIGKEHQGLYMLQGSSPVHSHHINLYRRVNAAPQLSSDSHLWHLRLRYTPTDVIRKHTALQHLTHTSSPPCIVCPIAKQVKLPFLVSTSSSQSIFELVHCDMWGPYKHPTYDDKRYFVTIVDDYSRYVWLFLIHSKSCTIVVLREFINKVKNLFSSTIKTLRTDNGCEFLNTTLQNFLASLGIQNQTSCVYTPQQNRVAERRHRTILGMERSLRFQSEMPLRFWGECVSTAVYILNRILSRVIEHKTPYELLHMQVPNLSHLRVFGCLCYAIAPRELDKFASKAIPAVLMGYSESQKGYKLFDLAQKSMFACRNVVFKEDIFPFKHMKGSINPIFQFWTCYLLVYI